MDLEFVRNKNWVKYIGSRNCGKGVQYDILYNAFEDYVSILELGNMLYNRITAGSENIDCSKKLYWLMDLEFVRNKNWVEYIGSRNCEKGVQYDIL